MKNSEIRNLLLRYTEESEVSREVTESILRKILKILFGDKRDSEAPKIFPGDKKEGG